MTAIIVNVIGFFNTLVVSAFPTISLGDGVLGNVLSAIQYFLDFVASINWLIPVNDCLLIISLVIGYKITIFIIFCINWVIRRIGDIIP